MSPNVTSQVGRPTGRLRGPGRCGGSDRRPEHAPIDAAVKRAVESGECFHRRGYPISRKVAAIVGIDPKAARASIDRLQERGELPTYRAPKPELTDGQRALAESAARLAMHLARRAVHRRDLIGLAADRVLDAATDALFNAARDFDPARGFKFTTVVGTYVRKAIAREVSQGGHRRAAEPDREGYFEDATPDPRDPVGEADDRDETAARVAEVRAAMAACLSEQQAVMVALYFGLDGSPPLDTARIAARLGVTPNRAACVVRLGVWRLRHHFGLEATTRPPMFERKDRVDTERRRRRRAERRAAGLAESLADAG